MAVVSMANSLTLGASDDLANYYRQVPKAMQDRQDSLCRVIKTELREVKEPLKESIPFPELWPYGAKRSFKTFRDRLLTYTHRNWNLAIPWLRWDEEDEVMKGDLQTHLQGLAHRFRQLIDQLMVDHMLSTATLGQTLGNAFDGAALYSATDGDGAARFGVTGGNKITHPLSTEGDAINALLNCEVRLRKFKDTETQPFFDADEVTMDHFIVCCGPDVAPIFTKARELRYGVSNNNVAAASENIAFQKFDLWVNPRISSTTKALVFLKHEYFRPFAWIQRKSGPEIQRADQGNWDAALEQGMFALMGHTREAVEVFSPHSTIEISTS